VAAYTKQWTILILSLQTFPCDYLQMIHKATDVTQSCNRMLLLSFSLVSMEIKLFKAKTAQ